MSGIKDGFGDDPTVDEVLAEEEEFLVRSARHALVMNRGHGFSAGADDDAVQEARIAAWQSWEKHHNRAYLNVAARQRLTQHIVRDQWFGIKPTAHEKDPIRRTGRASFDDPDNVIDVVVDSATWVDQVLLGYHEGQILQAISELTFTQREYCVLRFWGGMTDTEIAAHQGKTRGGVSSVWCKTIKPHLASQLELLRDLV